MRHIKHILFMLAFLVNSYNSKAQWPVTDPAYTITFGDEFNDTTGYMGKCIDFSKWNTSTGWNLDSTHVYLGSPVNAYVPQPGYNLYYPYDTMNVHVIPGSSGTCRLIGRKGNYVTDCWHWTPSLVAHQKTFQYSNGVLSSMKSFRFGYYEARFRLPSNVSVPSGYNSYQPTFWLYGKSASVGHSEIDIYEIRGTDGDFTNGGYFKSAPSNSLSAWHLADVDTVANGVWHTAAVNWDQNKIDYYFDGEKKRTHTTYADSLIDMRIFFEANIPLYLGSNVPIDPVNTIFPYVYEIDYVRVYQPKKACDTSKVYLTTTLSSYNSKLYKDLTLGGSGGSAYFNNGISSAYGNDFVLLLEGTTIDNNMEMYFDVLPCNDYQLLPFTSTQETPPLNNYRHLQIKHE